MPWRYGGPVHAARAGSTVSQKGGVHAHAAGPGDEAVASCPLSCAIAVVRAEPARRLHVVRSRRAARWDSGARVWAEANMDGDALASSGLIDVGLDDRPASGEDEGRGSSWSWSPPSRDGCSAQAVLAAAQNVSKRGASCATASACRSGRSRSRSGVPRSRRSAAAPRIGVRCQCASPCRFRRARGPSCRRPGSG
jgi:hypothetical protein